MTAFVYDSASAESAFADLIRPILPPARPKDLLPASSNPADDAAMPRLRSAQADFA
jgi:hypothetical protein